MYFDIYFFLIDFFRNSSTGGYYNTLAAEFCSVVLTSMIGIFSFLLIPAIVWCSFKFILSCMRF